MAFDLKVVFTGLSLVCLQNQKPCEEQSLVYLVNATEEQTVCGWKMEGHHRPLLAFDARYMLPGSTSYYYMGSGPDGYRYVVAPLTGKELCIRIAPPRGKARPLPNADVGPEEVEGRSESQDHPEWWKSDSLAFDWIPYLVTVEKLTGQHDYCPQVNTDLKDNKYVASRVQLHGGTIMTYGCKRLDLGWWERLFGLDYVIWETTKRPIPDGEDFPKALPDQVVWKVEDLPDDHIVLLQDCEARPPRTLFRIDTAGKDLDLHISNLPEHDVKSASGPHLDHFRWYYRLLDWGNNQCSGTDHCPEHAALPTLPPGQRFGDDAMWGLLSSSVHCPPAGSGSP